MRRSFSEIRLIGFVLAALYAVSLLIYLQTARVPDWQQKSIIPIILFSLLVLGSIAAAFYKEWGRILLITGNILIGGYLIGLYSNSSDFVPISYIYMSFIIVMFFTQNKTKLHFVSPKKTKWQSVLIIDDEDMFVKTVRPVLIQQGYSVLTAQSGEEGITVAKRQRPDLILLDVILPGIKGREVCRRLKENEITRSIPVVFLTAKGTDDDIRAEMEVGGISHLTKPVAAKDLISTVESVLSKKSMTPKEWKSILVVDDDETQQKTLRAILLDNGYAVLTASTGENGIQVAKKQKPNLIILDVILPKMKGREVCRRIKEDEETKDIPVIFLTAKDSADDKKAEMEAGAISHLTKPVNAKELLAVIEQTLKINT